MYGTTELICSIKIKLSKPIRPSQCIPSDHGNIKVTSIKLEGNKLPVINHYHGHPWHNQSRGKTIARMWKSQWSRTFISMEIPGNSNESRIHTDLNCLHDVTQERSLRRPVCFCFISSDSQNDGSSAFQSNSQFSTCGKTFKSRDKAQFILK